MKLEGIGQFNGATGVYTFDELALARISSPDLINVINKITSGWPLDFFQVDQVEEFVAVDIVFCDTALSILYNTQTGGFTHEQMGISTIKRFLKAGTII